LIVVLVATGKRANAVALADDGKVAINASNRISSANRRGNRL